MGLKQGEIKVSGRWKQDRRQARQRVYRVAGGSQEIERVGESIAAEAKRVADTAVRSKATMLGELSLVPSEISFKDIREWSIRQNSSVSKRGDQILVGLVISDSFQSMALEFGAQTKGGFISPAGFMRAAALKVAKRGYRFQPAKSAEQQKALAQGQKFADKQAKATSTRNRKNARKRWGRKRRRR